MVRGRFTHELAIGMRADELRKYRRKKKESQGMFWARFGVTQSRGSRFEKGAEIPKPVAILLELYFNGVVTDVDLEQRLLPPLRERGSLKTPETTTA